MNTRERIERLKRQQDETLEQMREIRVMRSGTLSSQTVSKRGAQRESRGTWGPYFVWQGYREGKHFSARVRAEQSERYRREIYAHRRFEGLCRQYAALGETLADARAERSDVEGLKKGLKSPRSSKRK